MRRMELQIGGMSCGHCVRGVSQALSALQGVAVEDVQVGSAVVSYDPDAVTPAAIEQAVADEGYTVVGAR